MLLISGHQRINVIAAKMDQAQEQLITFETHHAHKLYRKSLNNFQIIDEHLCPIVSLAYQKCIIIS